MLEREIIQTRGFKNTRDCEGNVTGFEFRIRNSYYRGAWLSMYRPGDVVVDGVTYPAAETTWVVNGIEYTPEEMLEVEDEQWPIDKAATVKVKKPGGLEMGYHDVEISYRYIMSYIPPIVNSDEAFARMPARPHTRRMILVN